MIRALKDIGWVGFSLINALTPLANMGQVLYEPPDVSGWDTGRAWFSWSIPAVRPKTPESDG